MSALGYSRLLKEIHGVTPDTLRKEFSLLLQTAPSQRTINALGALAEKEEATVSELLRAIGAPHTGGSYLGLKNAFDELVDISILAQRRAGRRTYYRFATGTSLQSWLGTRTL